MDHKEIKRLREAVQRLADEQDFRDSRDAGVSRLRGSPRYAPSDQSQPHNGNIPHRPTNHSPYSDYNAASAMDRNSHDMDHNSHASARDPSRGDPQWRNNGDPSWL
jgi:hypothetical protein